MSGKPHIVFVTAHDVCRDPRIVCEIETAKKVGVVSSVTLADHPEPFLVSENGVQIAVPLTRRGYRCIVPLLRFVTMLRMQSLLVWLLASMVPSIPLLRKIRSLRRSSSTPQQPTGSAPAGQEKAVDPPGFLGLAWYLGYLLDIADSLLSGLEQLPVPADILHCADVETLLAGAIWKRRHGCRLVYDAHEFTPYMFAGKGRLWETLLKAFEGSLVLHCDEVITVNPHLARSLGEEYGLNKVSTVLNAEPKYNNTNMNNLHSFAEIEDLAADRVRFYFMGGFAEGRGLENFISAWERVAPENGVLFLRGPDNAFRQRLEHSMKAGRTLGTSVFFLNSVSEQELVPSARVMDVGIIPYSPVIKNNYLSLPNKLSQYAHAGVAILANNLSYVSSIVNEYQCGAVYSDAVDGDLEEKLRTLLSNPAGIAAMKQGAVRLADELLNWEAQESALLACYGFTETR